jgi:hypothetical protein
MKSVLVPLATLTLLTLAQGALAVPSADVPPKEGHRSTRLGTCSKEAHAKGLKGPERKKYLSTCLAAGHAARPATRVPAS